METTGPFHSPSGRAKAEGTTIERLTVLMSWQIHGCMSRATIVVSYRTFARGREVGNIFVGSEACPPELFLVS